MEPMELPLTYKGEQVGTARVEIDDTGVHITGTLYNTEKAVEIMGPSIERVSLGFEPPPVNQNVFNNQVAIDMAALDNYKNRRRNHDRPRPPR